LSKAINKPKVQLSHSASCLGAEEKEAVCSTIDHNFVGYGPRAAELEREFCRRSGRKYGFAVSSGAHALSLAMRALDLPQGSLVSVPVLTCASVPGAALADGHDIWLADVDRHDLTIRPESIHPRSAAFIAPHAYGRAVDVGALERLSIPWIEDCATSPSVTIDGKSAGAFGTIAVFSLASTKYITAGGGGVLLTDDADIAARVDDLLSVDRRPGATWKKHTATPLPGRLPDLNAALALVQLSRLPDFTKKRRDIAQIYMSRLGGLGLTQHGSDTAEHTYFRFLIRTAVSSGLIAAFLQERGIDARTSINPWLDEHFAGHERISAGPFPAADYWRNNLLSLPIHPLMSLDDAEVVVEALLEAIRACAS